MRGKVRFAARALLAPTAAIVVATACGGGDDSGAAAQAAQRGGPGGGGPGGARVVPVEAVPVERGSIARAVTVSGVIEPIREVGVNAQASGALLSVNVEEGNAVRPGTVLARVDARELQAQLTSAQASFQVAEAAFERAQQLRDRQVITEAEYERDRAAYAAAGAQLEQIRTRIGYTTVNAPIAGIITAKNVERGDVVAPQTRLFTIADVSTMVVRVGVSELDVVELNVGDRVSVGLDAFPDRELVAEIRRIFPSADPATRLVPVEVALAGESARSVRPGFLARSTFSLGTREGVLLIPVSALIGGAGAQSVFVLDDGRAIRRTVTTGLISQGRVEIVFGLQEGEQVVTLGNNNLRDGTTVRVVSDTELGAAPAASTTRRTTP